MEMPHYNHLISMSSGGREKCTTRRRPNSNKLLNPKPEIFKGAICGMHLGLGLNPVPPIDHLIPCFLLRKYVIKSAKTQGAQEVAQGSKPQDLNPKEDEAFLFFRALGFFIMPLFGKSSRCPCSLMKHDGCSKAIAAPL